MLSWINRRQLDGLSSWRFQRKAFHSVTESLKSITCYPPDQFIFLQSEDVDELVPSFAAAFSYTEQHLLAVADEDGVIRFFDTRKSLANGFVSGFEGHDNAIFDIVWAHQEPWIVTASGDQTAVLWDAPTGKQKSVFKQHTGSLKSVSFGYQSNNILATGARDGSIMIWDTRCTGKARTHTTPVATICKAHEDKDLSRVKPRWRKGMSRAMLNINPLQSVTAVIFQSDSMLLSSGSADGVVKMWDIRALPRKNKKSTPESYQRYDYSGNSQGKHGFSALTLDSSHSRVYANCTDGTIYAYDCVGLPSSEPVATYSGHINSTFYVKSVLSADDTYLLSGSSDSNAYIWKVDEPDYPPIILSGHSGEVTAVAWSPLDRMRIVTCADDCTMRIWRRRTEDEKDEEKPIGNAKWQTPSEEPYRDYSESSQPSSSMPDIQTPHNESLTMNDKDLSKTVNKRKFNLKAWAMTPGKEKKTNQEEGASQSNEDGQESLLKGQDGDILRTKDGQRVSADETSTASTSIPSSTNKDTKESQDSTNTTYCKKRARRISSLKDWIDGKDNNMTKSKNTAAITVTDGHLPCQASTSFEIPRDTSVKENKENCPGSEKGTSKTGSPLQRNELTALQEHSNAAGPSNRIPHLNETDTRQPPGSKQHPKRESLKRGRGDQIFDYFQPLKRMRQDSPPEKR